MHYPTIHHPDYDLFYFQRKRLTTLGTNSPALLHVEMARKDQIYSGFSGTGVSRNPLSLALGHRSSRIQYEVLVFPTRIISST